jgi:hypothetical protein
MGCWGVVTYRKSTTQKLIYQGVRIKILSQRLILRITFPHLQVRLGVGSHRLFVKSGPSADVVWAD